MPITLKPNSFKIKDGNTYQQASCFKGDKGDRGDPGVYYGSTEPTDPSAKVWINSDGGAEHDDVLLVKVNNEWIGIEAISGHHVFIKYAASQPTQDSDMKTTPDAWIGIYTGLVSSAPEHYTSYSWYNIKGDPAPQEDVEAAVDAWLDEHPEATTTVEDGSITRAKLNASLASEIDHKAPAIIAESAQKDSFTATELAQYEDYNIVCDATGHTSVYKLLGEDIFPDADSVSSTYYSKSKGRTVVWNGTLDSTKSYLAYVGGVNSYAPLKTISNGDTVNLFVCSEGANAGQVSRSGEVQFQFLRADGTSIGNKYVAIPLTTGYATATYTVSDDVAKVRVYVHGEGSSVFDNFNVSWGGSVDGAYTQVAGGEELTFAKSDIGNNGFSILPVTACVKYVSDTKEYVDNNIPEDVVTDQKLMYLSPEMYGAAGNDIDDDTSAVQACITAAIAAGKPVRGYGAYKTSSTVVIDGSYVDIYLKYLDYRGSSYAVTIAGKNNRVQIDNIFAQNDGASGIGIIEPESTDSTERLMISGVCIYAHTHDIVMLSPNVWMTYIVIQYKMLYTARKTINGDLDPGDFGRDAIYADGNITEVAVHDASFVCQNGWCFEGPNVKMFNCTMEHNVWGGVYSSGVTMQNCRARELMDCLMPYNTYHNASSGILFKIKEDTTTPGIVINVDDCVYYDSIDISDAIVQNDGTGTSSVNNGYYGFVHCPICIGDLNYTYGEYWLGKEMLLHGKDKVCVPQFRGIITITNANCDLRDPGVNTLASTRYPYPYKFVIGVSDCVIHLAPSYCAEGYDEFVVDMSTYKATVYDRRGNVIFNPVGQNTGVYKFSAFVDNTVDNVYQHPSFPINSGYCDVWQVDKIG